MANIGTFPYFITLLSTYFLDGEFPQHYKLFKMKDTIHHHLEGHMAICGFGRTGSKAALSFKVPTP
ncbi:MAG: hypothetical protein IPH78_15350 [Bacteroidetes bacterium]|nr:hypothetical protein [Bacteroidota bacterium]